MNIEKLRQTFLYKQLILITNRISTVFRLKEKIEYLYWKLKKIEEKEFNNEYYEYFYTFYFGLKKEDYTNKKILDIGCGPRGSLEWADNTNEKYGIDPLAEKYLKLGAKKHSMKYIQGVAEKLPFDDIFFDYIFSFNSLDHVDNLEKSILEITRVLKQGGRFLLISDIHSVPTITEPSAFSWDIVERFKKDFTIEIEKHIEGHELWKSLRKNTPFNHNDTKQRYGILAIKMLKN